MNKTNYNFWNTLARQVRSQSDQESEIFENMGKRNVEDNEARMFKQLIETINQGHVLDEQRAQRQD